MGSWDRMRGDLVLSRCGDCGVEVLREEAGKQPVPMNHLLSCRWAFSGAPRCAWCGGQMSGKKENALCCSQRCKAARWKHTHGYGHQKQRKQCSYTKSSGLQVSYKRGVMMVTGLLMSQGYSRDRARELAGDALTRSLSARQQEQLAQRSKGEATI